MTMLYGKATTKIESEHGALYLTVTGGVCSLKQGTDLIRLDLPQLRELAADIDEAITALGFNPSNKSSNNRA